ncbi:MAG: hypothetical protein ACI4HI_16705 [Lachnospiraceae bacterium]
MRKKSLAILVLAAALIVQPVCAIASPSTSSSVSGGSSGGGGGGGGSTTGMHSSGTSTSAAAVTVSASGVKTTGAATSTSTNGTVVSVVVETTTTTGQLVTVNSKGQAVVGDTAVSFANGEAATAGLPDAVVAAINQINAGQPLAEIIKTTDMTGYNALTGTNAIITNDAVSGEVKVGTVEVTLYVPNLIEGLNNVAVLFYNNANGLWELLPIVKMDPAAKTVVVNISGSGTLSVVYTPQ